MSSSNDQSDNETETSFSVLAAETLQQVTQALGPEAEVRSGQIDMTNAVAEAIDNGRHLIVQAGTGTGKSLAYLVPLCLSGRRCVVATATKALQDQVSQKEMPHLASVLDVAPSWAVLKGRSNYLCRQRLKEVRAEFETTLAGTTEFDTQDIADEVRALIEFGDTTVTGDRAELDFEPDHRAWSALSVTSQECPGRKRCPVGDSCFVELARDCAADSDIIIVNTHLLGIDLMSDGAILPEHDIVVIDEAHQLEDTATATFGWAINQSRLFWLARAVGRVIARSDWVSTLTDLGYDLTSALEPYSDRRLTPVELEQIATVMLTIREQIAAVHANLKALPKIDNTDLAAAKVRAEQACVSLLEELDASSQVSEAFVAWVSKMGGSIPTLNVAPLDVAPLLGPRLFDQKTVVLTSATLNEATATRVGLRRGEHVRLEVESPFDYASNGLLYCAKHLPEPRSADFQMEMLGLLSELIYAAGGRTLSLFTSWKMMDAAVEHLSRALKTPVLSQRDMPKPALIEAFRSDESATLLATLGFWQGIDVAGSTLSLVTIDRLPFPRPNDPLHEARRERAGRRAFGEIDLPRCATLLAQGAGRLIRSRSDRGVVAVLDSRMATKRSYRWDLVNALPPFRRTSNTQEVLEYLRSLAAQNEI